MDKVEIGQEVMFLHPNNGDQWIMGTVNVPYNLSTKKVGVKPYGEEITFFISPDCIKEFFENK